MRRELLVGSKMANKLEFPIKKVGPIIRRSGLKASFGRPYAHKMILGWQFPMKATPPCSISNPFPSGLINQPYKYFTLKDGGFREVETVVIDYCPRYMNFLSFTVKNMAFWEDHWRCRAIWNQDVLSSKNYVGKFMDLAP